MQLNLYLYSQLCLHPGIPDITLGALGYKPLASEGGNLKPMAGQSPTGSITLTGQVRRILYPGAADRVLSMYTHTSVYIPVAYDPVIQQFNPAIRKRNLSSTRKYNKLATRTGLAMSGKNIT